MATASLRGITDMHVHSSPDIRERRYTDFVLAKAAVKVGAKAVVIKSHHGTTMNRAYLTNLFVKEVFGDDTGFTMYGSVTLNNAIGGLNPFAVDTGFKMGAKVVWLPTTHAKNQIAKNGKTGGIECTAGGKVVEPLREIFRIIKDNNGVLGTGHLSPEEIFVVVEEARNMGLEKVVVTHPEFWVVGMSLEDQIKITKDYNVILERCFAQPMGGGVYKSNLEDNLLTIREVGYKNVMVDTDGGQVENPPWEDALAQYMQYLLDNGIPEDQLDYMTRTIGSELLGIA